MSRYDTTFANLKARGEIAFVPFAVAGDPDLTTSIDIFKTYIDNGADILEIGYPFSDPVADGPVNQRAAQRAIAAGLTHATFFKMVRALRAVSDIPIGLLLYANSVHFLGYRTFCRRAADAGVDSLLVADMPPEESDELLAAIKSTGLKSVFIVSELTPPKRAAYICSKISGFVYVVSRLGATGAQSRLPTQAARTLQRLQRITARPFVVGFGLSEPRHIAAVKFAGAQGAIVGSALVAQIEKNLSSKKAMLKTLGTMTGHYKHATR
ncbi:MAG: tryptophan synthase subunit alpha [Chitinivibrionales bacterium]|nr:tryptophan synthase subunit alpha [Chitinivibrionales bacterium]